MPQSWSPPLPGVSRRQGISRSQLLSSWSRVWIYMLAGRAPHKSKLVVWALSGSARAGPTGTELLLAGIYRHRTGRATGTRGWPRQFYIGQHSGHRVTSNQWSASREVSSHQLAVSDNLWGHCSDIQRDLHEHRVLSGNGDIKRWDPLTQW